MMMPVTPGKEHDWLQRLVGEWSYTVELPQLQPDLPGELTGRESVRSIGGLWIMAEGEGKAPGGEIVRTVLTLGYDSQKKRFVGTWLGSMMANLWVYEGSLDESEKVLTLETEGPGPDGKLVKVKEVIEIKSENERSFTSFMPGASGQLEMIMSAKYTRAN